MSLAVGFLIDRWEPARGGAERALAELARHLEQRGHAVHAFALSAAAEDGAGGVPGRFQRVGPGLGLPTRAAREARLGRALVEAARRAGCERTVGVRHLPRCALYWPHAGSHLRALQARALSGGRPAPRRVTGRHRVFLDFERELLAGAGARRVVCVSELVRAELAELYPACVPHLELVPNGVDLERFHPRQRAGQGRELRARLGVPEGTALLAFAARDPRLKGFDVLVEALAGLRARPWRLVVAGPRRPGPWQRILDRRLGPERARVLPHVPAEALHAAAELGVLPTWRDTSSLVLLESLASGTPFVTTALCGEAGLLDEPELGTVLARPEAGALRDALEAWLTRLERGEPARESIRARVQARGLGPWLARLERILVEAV